MVQTGDPGHTSFSKIMCELDFHDVTQLCKVFLGSFFVFELFIQKSCDGEENRRASTLAESLDMRTLLFPLTKSKPEQNKKKEKKISFTY